MLILTRRANEAICIGDSIRVSVVAVNGNRTRLGIQAPKHIPVDRKEIRDAKKSAEE
jgi:carbon storage regulator